MENTVFHVYRAVKRSYYASTGLLLGRMLYSYPHLRRQS